MQSQYPNNLLEMLIELMDSKQHPWFDDAKVGLSRGKTGICIIASSSDGGLGDATEEAEPKIARFLALNKLERAVRECTDANDLSSRVDSLNTLVLYGLAKDIDLVLQRAIYREVVWE